MTKLYQLIWRGYENASHFYFQVPGTLSKARWTRECRAACHRASRQLLKETDTHEVIAWSEVAELAAAELAKRYTPVKVAGFTLTGGCPLPGDTADIHGELLNLLANHNAQAEALVL